MKDLHIAVSADYDLQMYAEDATDAVQINLTAEDAEKIYEWLKEYLNK
jgi:hypothetical protein